MHKALGIGEIVLDKSLILRDYPKEDSKVKPEKVKYSLGGPVAAALILLSRLGVECRLVASIADDAAGGLIRSKLAKEKVKLISLKAKTTKQNTVLINDKKGSRTIIKDSSPTPPIKTITQKLIKQADIFIFDRHEPKAFDFVLAKRKNDQKIVFDPSTELSKKTLHMAKHADMPIFPIEVLGQMGLKNIKKSLGKLHSKLEKHFIITAGKNGSIFFDGEKSIHYPALNIDPVDTLGAGDLYRGAFAWGLLNNWDLKKCIRYANIVAGLQCTRIGNGSAIPKRSEITRALLRPKFRKTQIFTT